MPDAATWPAFDNVSPAADGSGAVSFTVPRLESGTYQLWWRCDNDDGPGSGIHYGTGERLSVAALPATSTHSAARSWLQSRPPIAVLAFVLAGGALASIALHVRLRKPARR